MTAIGKTFYGFDSADFETMFGQTRIVFFEPTPCKETKIIFDEPDKYFKHMIRNNVPNRKGNHVGFAQPIKLGTNQHKK